MAYRKRFIAIADLNLNYVYHTSAQPELNYTVKLIPDYNQKISSILVFNFVSELSIKINKRQTNV